jgi:hypothetical protein
MQPVVPFGQMLFCILGHFSQAIPQTPIRMLNSSIAKKRLNLPYLKWSLFLYVGSFLFS